MYYIGRIDDLQQKSLSSFGDELLHSRPKDFPKVEAKRVPNPNIVTPTYSNLSPVPVAHEISFGEAPKGGIFT